MRRLISAFLLLLLLPLLPATAADGPLTNPGFVEWGKGLPAGWARSVGARQSPGDAPSSIEQLQGGGVALAGDAATRIWHMLSQRVTTKPQVYLELTYTARATGLKREAGQYGSCYVGFVLRDVEGKPAGFTVQDVRHAAWRTETVRLRVPAGVGAVDVALFLSQTGRLEVRDVELRESKAEDSIDILIRAMDRHYSFFAAHEIDWRQEAHRHRRAAETAKTPAAFIAAIKPLLAKLEDGHVWIQAPDGSKTYTWTPQVEMNFDLQYLLGHLQDVQQVIRNVLSATTPEGYGYLALGTMQGTPTQYAAVERAFRAHFDKPGIVLDLRVNGGGQEVWGQRLCALLAKERTLYGRAQVRSGPKHTDLQPGGERHILPAKSGRYAGPVVALIGPGCVSSGEGMAMMLKALPDIPLVGLPTRGSSGNPQPVHLPNGVTVWFSRWISQLPDGTPIERQGVPPDVRVEHARGKDPALAEAVKILKAKAEKR